MSVYKSGGKTAKEAFDGIWDLLKYSDDYCLRKDDGEYQIRLEVKEPTREVREDFEKTRYFLQDGYLQCMK